MLKKRQEIFQNAIEGKLGVQDRASERLQDQIIEEIEECVHRKTQEALQLAGKEHDLWMYRNERLQGVRKLRKHEEIAWPDWEEARKMEDGEWRLEPEGEAELPEVVIVSDAVEGTLVHLDGESRHEQLEAKLSRK